MWRGWYGDVPIRGVAMKVFAPLLLAFTVAAVFAAPVPKTKAPDVDIRDAGGKVILTADDIVGYDWDTHTLTLKEGEKAKFAKSLQAARRFAVCIDGKPAMEGQFVPPTISSTRKGPVIVLPDFGDAKESEVSIRGGYPGLVTGDEDKRNVKELKDALSKAGKLKAAKK
jgi:hypothetical protein